MEDSYYHQEEINELRRSNELAEQANNIALKGNKINKSSIVISIVAICLSIFSIAFSYQQLSHDTKEKIDIKMYVDKSAETANGIEVRIDKNEKPENMSDDVYAQLVLNDFINYNTTIRHTNLKRNSPIQININANRIFHNISSFPVHIVNTEIYGTNDSEQMKLIKEFNSFMEKNNHLIGSVDRNDTEYVARKRAWSTNYVAKNSADNMPLQYEEFVLQQDDIIKNRIRMGLSISEDMEEHIRQYMIAHRTDLKYDYNSSINNNSSQIYNSDIQSLVANAVFDYFNQQNKEIVYTCYILTSRNNAIYIPFVLYRP